MTLAHNITQFRCRVCGEDLQFDMTDPIERSKAECIGRRQVIQMVEAMRQYGGEHLKDIEIVEMLIRESQAKPRDIIAQV